MPAFCNTVACGSPGATRTNFEHVATVFGMMGTGIWLASAQES
jgi:hypothetical protein